MPMSRNRMKKTLSTGISARLSAEMIFRTDLVSSAYSKS